jgi:hypothetical protein
MRFSLRKKVAKAKKTKSYRNGGAGFFERFKNSYFSKNYYTFVGETPDLIRYKHKTSGLNVTLYKNVDLRKKITIRLHFFGDDDAADSLVVQEYSNTDTSLNVLKQDLIKVQDMNKEQLLYYFGYDDDDDDDD